MEKKSLTSRVKYKLYVDYAGEYSKDGKMFPLLALRLYVASDSNNSEKRWGVNLISQPTDDFAFAVKDLSEKVDKWLGAKYDEWPDALSWLTNNAQAQKRFERWVHCDNNTLKSLQTQEV